VAVVELVWVLSFSYGLTRDQLVEALDRVLQAQRRFATGGADFADCLIERIAQAQGCATTMTFDTGAAKAAGMTPVV
jgi:predicted nucleic-acid-binding protein